MTTEKKEYICIDFGSNCKEFHLRQQRSLVGDSLIDKLMDKEADVMKIPADIMSKNIAEAVSSFVNVLDEVNEKSAEFEIDEVEFGLCVGTDGSISIASALNGGMSAQTTVKIKMKKKNKGDAQ